MADQRPWHPAPIPSPHRGGGLGRGGTWTLDIEHSILDIAFGVLPRWGAALPGRSRQGYPVMADKRPWHPGRGRSVFLTPSNSPLPRGMTGYYPPFPQPILYFSPAPQGQGSLGPIFFCVRRTVCTGWAARRFPAPRGRPGPSRASARACGARARPAGGWPRK